MNNFLKIMQDKSHILADGATGTNLFAMGLETGDPPEPWNLEHKDRIPPCTKALLMRVLICF